MPASAHAVAHELRTRRPGLGKLALHKLLYFCQGHHLATFEEPLFDEAISAWDNGPVVGEVWFVEDRGLPPPASAQLGEAELNTIGYVVSRYGALSGQDLMHLTHSEDPWRWANADRQPGTSKRIELEWIKQYFRAGDGEHEGLALDARQVEAWLSDAGARRDMDGPLDDPDEIARQIRELRERTTR